MEAATVNLKTEALKNGIIWGVINIVIFLVMWYLLRDLIGGYVHTGISFAIGIALAVFFCIDMRKKAGGYWTFGQALWPIFVTFVLSMGLAYVFTIIFGNYIDTSYPDFMKASVLEKSESMYKSIGFSQEQISVALAKVEETTDKQFKPTFFEGIVGFGIAAILYFIGALIFALIFKRANPNPYNLNLKEEQVS